MNILNFIARKSSLATVISGLLILLGLSGLTGLALNKFSPHPLPLQSQISTGITVINLERALLLHKQDLLFVDARSAADFAEAHIPGAVNLDYYDFDKQFPPFQKKNPASTPLAIYCQGISGEHDEDTCETSTLLAQRLNSMGYQHVLLFEEGMAYWQKNQEPVERGVSAAAHGTKKMPFVNYCRDLGILLIGIVALSLRKNRTAVVVLQILLGVVFIIGASSKVFAPDKLAVIIDAYRIIPPHITPYLALCMPWLEMFAGLALLTGIAPAAGALAVAGMNLFFIPALSWRALLLGGEYGISVFSVNFDCGCGLGENFAWVLILRDLGYLIIALIVASGSLRIGSVKVLKR